MGFVDVVWIIVLLLIGVVAARLSLRLYGTLASPLGFYVFGNCMAGCLYHLRLLAYPDASLQVHALIILSMITFVGAAVLVSRVDVKPAATSDDRGLAVFFYTTCAVATLGWILPLSIMLMKYGVGHLLANLWLLEYEFQMQYIGNINVINIIIFPTYIVKRARLGAGRFDVLFLVLSFFGLFLAGIKSFITYGVAAGMLAQSVSSRRGVRLWHLAGFGLVIVAYFVVYNKLIDVFVVSQLPGSSFPDVIGFLERPYFYVTGAWPAMDMIIQGQIDPAPVPGFVTFEPFWKIVADFFGIVEAIPRALPIVPVGPYYFNVYTLAGEVYWDWGVVGLVVFSAGIGGIVTRLYLEARRAAFWGNALLYAIIGYGVVISFFLFYFRFTMFTLVVYTLVVGFLPVGILRQTKKVLDES